MGSHRGQSVILSLSEILKLLRCSVLAVDHRCGDEDGWRGVIVMLVGIEGLLRFRDEGLLEKLLYTGRKVLGIYRQWHSWNLSL